MDTTMQRNQFILSRFQLPWLSIRQHPKFRSRLSLITGTTGFSVSDLIDNLHVVPWKLQ
jgi:hypothetical protein